MPVKRIATRKRKRARPDAPDHRARVGKQRRAKTRERIIASAVHVFAEKGPDAPVIDDFIAAAGVARGTFYNYYQSTDELFDATAKWLEDDLMVSIEQALQPVTDPVERLTHGLRLWLLKARTDSAWCAFIYRSRYRGALVERTLTNDLRDGLRAGAFSFASIPVARDFVVGAVLESMGRIAGGVSQAELSEVVRMILRGLGLRESAIRTLLESAVLEMHRPPRTLT